MMDPEFAEKLLDILIENSVRILDAHFGLSRVEPTFFQIVDLVREHPFLKAPLLARIENMLRKRETGILVGNLPPRELIELVAHEFRWDELREMAAQRLVDFYHGDPERAWGDIYYKILEAQEHDWPDRDFYQRYREQDR